MKEIDILGANRFETFTKTRSGSRALILRGTFDQYSHALVFRIRVDMFFPPVRVDLRLLDIQFV